MPPAAGRIGLLLLDLQEAVCRPNGEIGRSGFGKQVEELGVLENAERALETTRKHDGFVAFSRLAFDPSYSTLTSASPRLQALRAAGGLQAGGGGAQICSEVQPRVDELVVNKSGIDPFAGTPLLPALVRSGAALVALAGVATEHVVEAAARRASDAGIEVMVLADACASTNPEYRRHALEVTLPFYATVGSTDEFVALVTRRVKS